MFCFLFGSILFLPITNEKWEIWTAAYIFYQYFDQTSHRLFIWLSCQDDVCLYLFFFSHEDGTVRFWDASGVSLKPLYKLNTANIFQTDCDHNDSLTQAGEEEWPPFRKVRDLWEIWWVFSLLKQSLNHISGIVLFYLTLLTVFFHNKGSFSKFLDLSLLFFVFLIHLFLFSFSIKQLQSGAWPTLAYGIHTGADSIAPLIKSRLSVWWLKSFTDVCWRWSTLLLWMALMRCFCFSVFFSSSHNTHIPLFFVLVFVHSCLAGIRRCWGSMCLEGKETQSYIVTECIILLITCVVLWLMPFL